MAQISLEAEYLSVRRSLPPARTNISYSKH